MEESSSPEEANFKLSVQEVISELSSILACLGTAVFVYFPLYSGFFPLVTDAQFSWSNALRNKCIDKRLVSMASFCLWEKMAKFGAAPIKELLNVTDALFNIALAS